MTQIILERYSRRGASICGGAVLVVYALGAVFVDEGIVPEREGGVWGNDVRGVVGLRTLRGRAGVVELGGAIVEREDLQESFSFICFFFWQGKDPENNVRHWLTPIW